MSAPQEEEDLEGEMQRHAHHHSGGVDADEAEELRHARQLAAEEEAIAAPAANTDTHQGDGFDGDGYYPHEDGRRQHVASNSNNNGDVDQEAIPEGEALEAMLLKQYAEEAEETRNADPNSNDGANNKASQEGLDEDGLPHYHYLDEDGVIVEGDMKKRNGAGQDSPIPTSRKPEDDKDLMKGEADLKLIARIIAQFEALRKEVQLPVMDTILLEKYIVDPVEEAVDKSSNYYARRRAVCEQLCRDMPLIAAAAAAQVEPDIEGRPTAARTNRRGGGGGGGGGRGEQRGGRGSGGAQTTTSSANTREYVGAELTIEEMKDEIDATVGPVPTIPLTRKRVVGCLLKLINLMTDHRQATLDVLEAVGRREAALEDTMALAAGNEGGELHDVEAAVLIHKALFQVQIASLQVVERIQTWRDGLCMPHPFIVASGENYILKMFRDCNMLSEHLVIQKMLPMQHLFADFPLFSNVPSISRYVVGQEAARGLYTSVGAPPLDLKLQKRLIEAERYMHSEVELQLAMVRALLQMCGRSELLPILNISPVCPILKQQQKEAAERLKKAEGKVKPLRVCVPVGSSTVPPPPQGNPTSADVDPNSHVGQSVLKFTRGIRIASTTMRERYEEGLVAYFEVLKNPPCRDAYDDAFKEDHRKNTAEKAFKAMRTKSNTIALQQQREQNRQQQQYIQSAVMSHVVSSAAPPQAGSNNNGSPSTPVGNGGVGKRLSIVAAPPPPSR